MVAGTTKITIRQPVAARRKVEQAAALCGMTVTGFINATLERAADLTPSRMHRRQLSERKQQALLDLLAQSSGPNAELRRAAERYRKRYLGR